MAEIHGSDTHTTGLLVGERLTVEASTGSTGFVVETGGPGGSEKVKRTEVTAGATVTLGPFLKYKHYKVVCTLGKLTVSQVVADEEPAAKVEAFTNIETGTVSDTIGDPGDLYDRANERSFRRSVASKVNTIIDAFQDAGRMKK